MSNFPLHSSNFTEDTLVQQTTADYLQDELGWDSIHVYRVCPTIPSPFYVSAALG